MKARTALFAGSVAFAVLATLVVPTATHLVWNASPSIPTGLYAIRGKASLHVGERVAIEPPAELRRMMRERDRKSVVEGKSVSVRVDLGGRRNIKKKKTN